MASQPYIHTEGILHKPLNKYIQFTNISPSLTRDGVTAHLEAAAEHGFDAAMIAMCWVPLARQVLAGSGVKVATFFGFGMGSETLNAKLALLGECIALGADEVDYAPNMGYLLSGMYDEFQAEAAALTRAAEGLHLKIMLQMGMLPTEAEQRRAVSLAAEAGIPWIKNSSGGWPPGATDATPEHIRLIRDVVKDTAHVKASGGIKHYDMALKLIEAGAELLGTSAGVEIVTGSHAESDY